MKLQDNLRHPVPQVPVRKTWRLGRLGSQEQCWRQSVGERVDLGPIAERMET